MPQATDPRPPSRARPLPPLRPAADRAVALAGRRRGATTRARQRLRAHLWPILQAAAGVVVAWYLAVLLLPDPRPVFASIAAIVSLGATYGQRGQRALQLVGGVVLGITVADLLVQLIGSGPLQIGLLVLLAMSAALLLGGGELLVSEAAVSALLIAALDPGGGRLSPERFLEAVVGGGVALAISSLVFPPSPTLLVGRATQAVLADLGTLLGRVAGALERGSVGEAERALQDGRELDARLREVDDALAVGVETARFAPPRRPARRQLEAYAGSLVQVGYAVRNARGVARHAVALLRRGQPPAGLAGAVGRLSETVWALAASFEHPGRAEEARKLAAAAAREATHAAAGSSDVALVGLVAQLRATAVDLVRAAEQAAGDPAPEDEPATDELLLEPGEPSPARR